MDAAAKVGVDEAPFIPVGLSAVPAPCDAWNTSEKKIYSKLGNDKRQGPGGLQPRLMHYHFFKTGLSCGEPLLKWIYHTVAG